MTSPERQDFPRGHFRPANSGSRVRPVKQVIGPVEVQVRNFGPLELEVAVRRPYWRREVDEVLQEAAGESPELQRLSPDAFEDLAKSLTTALPPPTEVEHATEGTLEEAVEAALKGNRELEALSRQARTTIIVRLLNRLPKDERDVAIPVISMQSAEIVGQRLAVATWGLVGATGALVIATIVLIIVTATHK